MDTMIWTIRTASGLFKPVHVGITIEEKYIYIKAAYDSDLVEELRVFQGGKWEPEPKSRWRLPNTERNSYSIRCLGGWENPKYFNNLLYEKILKDITRIYSGLFPWQQEGIAFIIARQRCMLAKEMGLGKTLTCLVAMDYLWHHHVRDWWLIAPYGAQTTWEREIKKWKSKSATIGDIRAIVLNEINFSQVTTYESLHKLLDNFPPQGVIFDESIKIKNPNANRSQACRQLSENMRANNPNAFIICLSGAPSPKVPTEWWHQIECLQPGFLREGDQFKLRNRLAIIEQREGEFGKYPHILGWRENEIQALGRRLKPIVLSKKKSACLELPDKIFEIIKCPPSEETLRLARLITVTATTGIEALEKLRELSDGFQYNKNYIYTQDKDTGWCGVTDESYYDWVGSPKIEIIKQLLDFYSLDNGGPGRLVIYAWFRATIEQLKKEITPPWKVHTIGAGKLQDKVLEDFENSPDNTVIIANSACVYGLNLQKTHALVYYSNSFSPDHRVQSQDRRDRPGMDLTKGTKIIDLVHLDTDQLILDRINKSLEMQELTLEEIRKVLG